MGELEIVGRGRTADVYALDGARVLRRYREGGDATREAEVMTRLARCGYPVPEVLGAEGSDWETAEEGGAPGLDHAMSALILAEVAV
ncbi:hypothetical protein R6L23_21880 [Streptomyces sp. SR27]|nr:hypothetical protein [Streptomyces sp. SR27]MDV9190830.1 hypothetical protein [Streptomyces sp. SR27]